jgi:hypothetical protein
MKNINCFNQSPPIALRGWVVYYPTGEGRDDDYDYDGESYRYCGNAGWSSTIGGATAEIDDLLVQKSKQ